MKASPDTAYNRKRIKIFSEYVTFSNNNENWIFRRSNLYKFKKEHADKMKSTLLTHLNATVAQLALFGKDDVRPEIYQNNFNLKQRLDFKQLCQPGKADKTHSKFTIQNSYQLLDVFKIALLMD